MIDRKIDSFITTNNGINTHTYTGNELGKKAFVAKTSNVVSIPYNVLDCMYYDEGKKGEGHHNDDIWTNLNNNYQVDRGDDYTTLTATDRGTYNRYTLVNTDVRPLPFVVEFDKPVYTGNTSNAILVIGSRAIYYSYSGIANALHCKFQANADGTLEIWYDGEKKPTSNFNPDSPMGIRFQTQGNGSGDIIKFANFKVYPI